MNIKPGPNFLKFNDLPVDVEGEDPILPCNSFVELGLKQPIPYLLTENAYKQPTPIQCQVIPAIQAGRDALACSPTGSGKTAAYLIPIIDKLLKDWKEPVISKEEDDNERTCFPQVLIITVTREVAIQTLNMCRALIKNTLIVALPAYGGVRSKDQIADLTGRGAHIIVATPGRLHQFLRQKIINFSQIRFLVLDEADIMSRRGFKRDVFKMVNHETMKPKAKRQTLMFSATYDDGVTDYTCNVEKVAKKIMKNPLFIVVDQVNAPSLDVDERFFEIRANKAEKLLQLLREEEEENGPQLTLIFVNDRETADEVMQFLVSHRFNAQSIYGRLPQFVRQELVTDFKQKKFNILVSTEMMSRGLNIQDLQHVISYDLPFYHSEYVNRVGRTGRLGNLGKSTAFFEPGCANDEHIGPELVVCLGHLQKEVPDFLLKYAKDAQTIRAARRNVARRNR